MCQIVKTSHHIFLHLTLKGRESVRHGAAALRVNGQEVLSGGGLPPRRPPVECGPGEGNSGEPGGEIIRQIERVSFREDPAGRIGRGVGGKKRGL